jgi:hypothetical protein
MQQEYNLKTIIQDTPDHTFEESFRAKQTILPKVSGNIDDIGDFVGWPVIRLADNSVLVFGPHIVAHLEETI